MRMGGKIIWYMTTLGCAALFYGLGIYAQRLKKPMWFWAGMEVDADQITNLKQYNRANARMWKGYSLWFWAAALAEIWSPAAALTLLILGFFVGIPILVGCYLKICKKYTRQ